MHAHVHITQRDHPWIRQSTAATMGAVAITDLSPVDDPIVRFAVLTARRQVLLAELDDVAGELAAVVAELLEAGIEADVIANTMGLCT